VFFHIKNNNVMFTNKIVVFSGPSSGFCHATASH